MCIYMKKIRLGKTELMVTKTAFGALPVQRRSIDEGVSILKAAYNAGINFFDTARAYSDSEEKIGIAFSKDIRKNIIIATKTGAENADDFWKHLETSLKKLNTDYIDIYQFHNPAFLPVPGGKDGLYDAALEAEKQGKIRHIGITNHRLNVATEAAGSGLYDTLQFPFSMLAAEPEFELLKLCKENDVGFIAMKALSGGLITNAKPTFSFIWQTEGVVPIWGIQHMHELLEFLELDKNPPPYDDEMKSLIEHDKKALSGDFCRACGYCMPCPADIEINMAARIYFLITRAPYKGFISKEYQKKMAKVDNCINCNACKAKCPYELDTPKLLRKQYELYKKFVAEHIKEVE